MVMEIVIVVNVSHLIRKTDELDEATLVKGQGRLDTIKHSFTQNGTHYLLLIV